MFYFLNARDAAVSLRFASLILPGLRAVMSFIMLATVSRIANGTALRAWFGVRTAGFSISTPNISELATGGVIRSPMLAIVGDNPNAYRDPEIVTPQSTMAETFRRVLAETGGATKSLTINATGYNRPADLLADAAEADRYDSAIHGRYSYAGDIEAA